MSDAAVSIEARSGPEHAHVRLIRLVVVAAVALASFVCLAVLISIQAPTGFDLTLRSWALAASNPTGFSFFSFLSTVGSVTPMIVYASLVIVLLAIRRRSFAPLTVLAAPMVAVIAYLGTKSIFLRTRPSGVGNAFEGTYSFPSAHATTSSAVCFAVGYLVYREGVMSGTAAAVAAAAVSFMIGISRVYLDVHWATDVLGGWCLGVTIGALTAALYHSASDAPQPAVVRSWQ